MAIKQRYQFRIGGEYRRRDIFATIGVPTDTKGGNWDTGYNRYSNDWFVFCTVGAPGRTGHDYGNKFIGDDLLWYGKTGSKATQASIQSMLNPDGYVYVFYRENDRAPFIFAGTAHPKSVNVNSTPVEVMWSFDYVQPRIEVIPEEVGDQEIFTEGAVKKITVDAYERDPNARRKCVAHYGAKCAVCSFDFEDTFGELGEGFIHVHHLRPLHEIKEEYQIDPIQDLMPVCPNCHAMLHRRQPAFSIDELKILRDKTSRR